MISEQRLEGAKGTGQVDIWKRVFQAEETVSTKVQGQEHRKIAKASVAYAKWIREQQHMREGGVNHIVPCTLEINHSLLHATYEPCAHCFHVCPRLDHSTMWHKAGAQQCLIKQSALY